MISPVVANEEETVQIENLALAFGSSNCNFTISFR